MFFMQKKFVNIKVCELLNSPCWVRTNTPSVNSRMLYLHIWISFSSSGRPSVFYSFSANSLPTSSLLSCCTPRIFSGMTGPSSTFWPVPLILRSPLRPGIMKREECGAFSEKIGNHFIGKYATRIKNEQCQNIKLFSC